MNRRHFLSAGVAASVTGSVAEAAPVPASPPVPMKLGCQSAPTNEKHVAFLARYGVRNICGYPQIADGRLYTIPEELHRPATPGQQPSQFEIGITRFRGSGVPFNEKLSGTVSLAATFGTTTLNA